MNILVTGGAGFIGSHIVARLLKDPQGHQVTVLDEFNDYYDPQIKRGNVAAWNAGDRVKVVETDLRDRTGIEGVFAEGGFDAVIHLAARAGVRPSIEDPSLYVDVNVTGTQNVLEAARKAGVKKMVFASSSSVYGVNKKVPFAEEDRIERTISPYAATKVSGEHLCSNYAEHFGVDCVCLRFFTVYGPGQRPDLAISKFVKMLENGEPITRYGDGSTARDYTYIDDIVDGVIAALEYDKTPFEIINLGGSHTTTLTEMIGLVEEATGKTAVIDQHPDQAGDVPRTSADVTKAKALLGYEPKVALGEGIKRYVEWYRELQKS